MHRVSEYVRLVAFGVGPLSQHRLGFTRFFDGEPN